MQWGGAWRRIALVSAIVGAGVSAYLLLEYLNNSGGVCLTGGGCDAVRASSFAYPLGIPLPLFGVVFYAAAVWLTWRTTDPARLFGQDPRLLLAALGLVGIAVSAFLTGVEAFVIHGFCTWCLVQAGAAVALGVAALSGSLASRDGPMASRDASRRARRQAERASENERRSLRRYGAASSAAMAILVIGLLATSALAGAGAVAPSPSTGVDLAPASAPRIGHGPVTVVEFADFQCPACAGTSSLLQQLVDAESITLVYRYFPLPQHPLAQLTATAAAAAALQGKFWPLHDKIFATQGDWTHLDEAGAKEYLIQLATQAGLDTAQWETNWQSAAVAETVTSDATAAAALSLPQTPSIFINGTFYRGNLDLADLQKAVAAARGV